MATDIVQSLFGVTPEMYQQRQAAAADERALALAQLNPMQRAEFNIGRSAYQLAGALGGPDPELQRISLRQSIASQLDFNDPASIQRARGLLAQANDGAGVMQLDAVIRQAQESGALVRQRGAAEKASLAQAGKLEMDAAQETKLRNELAALGPNATQEQITAVMSRYGSPDRVLATLQASADREATRVAADERARLDREARAEAARLQNEARIEAARERGASAKEIAQMQIEGRKQVAELVAALKKPEKTMLAPSLQKEEGKDLELIDSLAMREESLKPTIRLLTPDPATKKPPLELGPAKNAGYLARNALGNSTPESRSFAALQRAVQEATNLKTDAAKGVQTDKDVLRFANELIAAFGKYDTQTTLEALTNFNKATVSAREKAEGRVDSRRRSQGVEPYYKGAATAKGTPENPIKLD
jgi:hypothetical protein